jgi:hypothetical protein
MKKPEENLTQTLHRTAGEAEAKGLGSLEARLTDGTWRTDRGVRVGATCNRRPSYCEVSIGDWSRLLQ